uniref:Uncharacterized protein n=1 Tax=Oryza rufipogon TaxID=4529 RepID=A0A0E0R7G6_ORYRU
MTGGAHNLFSSLFSFSLSSSTSRPSGSSRGDAARAARPAEGDPTVTRGGSGKTPVSSCLQSRHRTARGRAAPHGRHGRARKNRRESPRDGMSTVTSLGGASELGLVTIMALIDEIRNRRSNRSEDLPRDGGMTKFRGGGGAGKKLQHAHKMFDEMCRRVSEGLVLEAKIYKLTSSWPTGLDAGLEAVRA